MCSVAVARAGRVQLKPKIRGRSLFGDKTNVFALRGDVCGVLSYICGWIKCKWNRNHACRMWRCYAYRIFNIYIDSWELTRSNRFNPLWMPRPAYTRIQPYSTNQTTTVIHHIQLNLIKMCLFAYVLLMQQHSVMATMLTTRQNRQHQQYTKSKMW